MLFRWFFRGWWVVAFCLLATAIYIPSIRGRKAVLAELTFRSVELDKEILVAAQAQEELALQIASQSDPAWVEMILLREMGVVPEGFLKVHFRK